MTWGTRFFQNLTSFKVGYFRVNPDRGEGAVDWAWLQAQPALRETSLVRHVRLPRPVSVKLNGKTHEGVVLKPEQGRQPPPRATLGARAGA